VGGGVCILDVLLGYADGLFSQCVFCPKISDKAKKSFFIISQEISVERGFAKKQIPTSKKASGVIIFLY
jgi:hypothetical protein